MIIHSLRLSLNGFFTPFSKNLTVFRANATTSPRTTGAGAMCVETRHFTTGTVLEANVGPLCSGFTRQSQ